MEAEEDIKGLKSSGREKWEMCIKRSSGKEVWVDTESGTLVCGWTLPTLCCSLAPSEGPEWGR